MKQKINTLLASLALLLCSITMSAQTFEVDGIRYTVYNENEVYVSSGSQYEGDLIIPESVAYSGNDYKVTSIGDYAFSGFSGLTSVIIPNSVTSIGNAAFKDCSGLTSVTIGNSVTTIRENAFYGCSDLTSVTIGNSVTRIGEDAFRGCSNLKYVINFSNLHFRKGGQEYGYIADNASRVINAPNGSIEGDYVFAVIEDINTLCGYLGNDTELTLPANYKGQNYQIGSDAFEGYSSLTSVTIPNSVTSIGESAFKGCSGLTSIAIPNSVTSIEDYAFYGCSGLISVTIPNSVTSIEDYAFYGCSGLTSVTIGNSVTTIGSLSFL